MDTENIYIQYEPSSIGKRILALAIDLSILFVYFIFISFFTVEDEKSPVLFLISLLPAIFYGFIFETITSGQTIGKMFMHLKVVKLNGNNAGLREYLIRWVFNLVDWQLYGLIGLLVVLINKKGQRVGDLVAKTKVVDLNQEITTSYLTLPTLPESYQPKHDTKALTASDIRSIQRTIKKYKQTYNREKKYNLLMKEVARIEKKTGIVNAELPALEFLQNIIKDYTANSSKKGKIKM